MSSTEPKRTRWAWLGDEGSACMGAKMKPSSCLTLSALFPLQVLLLEAYEQLELDCAKEIDKALAKEREERGNLDRKVQFLQVN